jgi:hypothetical protein
MSEPSNVSYYIGTRALLFLGGLAGAVPITISFMLKVDNYVNQRGCSGWSLLTMSRSMQPTA